MSKALEMSTATTTDLLAGFLPLKPSEILLARGKRAEVVDRLGLNPCWVGEVILLIREEVMDGRSSRSRVLATGLRREMGQ
jgi:hypothetical protein